LKYEFLVMSWEFSISLISFLLFDLLPHPRK